MSNRPPFYKRRSVQIGAVVVAIPVLALAWWLGSPLFIDQVVDEPFPRAAMAVIPDEMTPSEVEQKMIEAEAVDMPVNEDMPETEPAVTTTAPASTPTAGYGAEESERQTQETGEADPTPTTVAKAPEEQPVEPEVAGPVALVDGALMDGDSFHKGSGQVTLYRLEDGSQLLRLENIEVTNGPQLHVILTPVHGVTGRDDVHSDGYLDLGPLKGNIAHRTTTYPPTTRSHRN